MEEPRRIMAVDYGEARIGVAVSDPLHLFARPHSIITQTRRGAALARLREIAAQENVGLVVIGLPTDSSGEVGRQARAVIRWARQLARMIGIPVVFWDESYSSEDAREFAHGRRKASADAFRHTKPVDDLAAATILQDYLQSRNENYEPGQSIEAYSHIE